MDASLIILFAAIPLMGAFLIPIIGLLHRNLQKYFALLILIATSWLAIHAFSLSGEFPLITKLGGWEAFEGIPIAIYLVLDGLSAFMLIIINILGLLAGLFAMSYMQRYTSRNNFYALFLLMVAGMNGVVLSGDLFNLYVFLEIAVISSYALVAFGVEKEELEASFKYQVLGGIASLLILFGIALIYWQTKTLNIADNAAMLKEASNPGFLIFTQLILIVGFGIKAALIPFHAWLPDAHSSAPSPISAMLSGVLIKAIGLYTLFRVLFTLFALTPEISITILTIGMLSMVIGVFLAIGQWDLKRLLAYHSISQMGYVVMGVGIGMLILARNGNQSIAILSIAGGLFHLINHATFKGLLFLNAGAIEYSTGTRDLNAMGGLRKHMPVTYASSLGASLSISGLPPFNGFFSKLIIVIAAVKGKFYLLAALAVIVSIITLASFMKFQRYAFFNKEKADKNYKEVPFSMGLSMIIMAILCLLLSLLAIPGIRECILDPAVHALINIKEYTTPITGM